VHLVGTFEELNSIKLMKQLTKSITTWVRATLEMLIIAEIVKKSRHFIELEGLLPCHKCPPPVRILSHINPYYLIPEDLSRSKALYSIWYHVKFLR